MKFFDRDLSWLSFNYRVLMEAMDEGVPILERLRFLAIYSSNLDEFFRVRVADIRNLARIDKKKINKRIDFKPAELLEEIHSEGSHQLRQYGDCLNNVLGELKRRDVVICTSMEEIPKEINLELLHYFKTRVTAFLKPIFLTENDELFLDNQGLYFAISFESGEKVCLKIPSTDLPRFYKTEVQNKTYFIFLDDVIRLHLDLIFPGMQVTDCSSVKVNKNADLQIDDEYEGDLVAKIEKQITKRNLGVPSRFLFDGNISDEMLATLVSKLGLSEDDVTTGGRYHNLNDFFQVSIKGEGFEYERQPPINVDKMGNLRSIFKLIEKEDLLFHFPYHSYDYVLQFFNEAAIDPEVEEINVTFYRMARNSFIGEALISAAANGKKVTVFMEVKARFDEENNLVWARRMQAAGITIIYSLPGLKVHAKVALVKKRKKMYGFFGTGNLNEKTSEIYCDHGLFSCHKEMTSELASVFAFLYEKAQPPGFKHLIVSQFNAMDRFEQMILRETENAKAGKEARIIVKLNNLQEQSLIVKLYEAAEAGVEVRMIVRSICCLVPGTNGIQVKRIVDRYLEHARVFYFHNSGKPEIFMGSSDWMNRNLHRRVEVTFPVYDKDMQAELLEILELQWNDDVKGVWLDEGLANIRIDTNENVRAQQDTYRYLSQ